MTIPLVNGKDIERLNNQELRSVMNELLTAEAGQHGIPLLDVDLTCRENDADAGIDGRIKWPDKNHDFFREGENVIQYKSGRITPADIRAEFKKSGVQRVLRAGGSYLLIAGADYVRTSVRLREETLKSLCKKQKIPQKRATIIFASAIG